MKSRVKRIKQLFVLCFIAVLVAGLLGVFIPARAAGDNSAADEIISLNASDRPLGEVLENLSMAADCQFNIDESWEDYPITAAFDNEPLYRGLKLILRDLNNAVIYGDNRTIRIIIYDESNSSDDSSGHSVSIGPSQDSVRQPPKFGAATSPQPEIESSETGSQTEESEQLPQATVETESDENETDEESSGDDDEEPGETPTEETSANLEAQEIESGSEEQSN